MKASLKVLPFGEEYIERPEEGQGPRSLARVKGHWTPKGLTHKGKPVISGVFVNVTGKTEKEKESLFALAREEIGEQAEGLDLYEVIDV